MQVCKSTQPLTTQKKPLCCRGGAIGFTAAHNGLPSIKELHQYVYPSNVEVHGQSLLRCRSEVDEVVLGHTQGLQSAVVADTPAVAGHGGRDHHKSARVRLGVAWEMRMRKGSGQNGITSNGKSSTCNVFETRVFLIHQTDVMMIKGKVF